MMTQVTFRNLEKNWINDLLIRNKSNESIVLENGQAEFYRVTQDEVGNFKKKSDMIWYILLVYKNLRFFRVNFFRVCCLKWAQLNLPWFSKICLLQISFLFTKLDESEQKIISKSNQLSYLSWKSQLSLEHPVIQTG